MSQNQHLPSETPGRGELDSDLSAGTSLASLPLGQKPLEFDFTLRFSLEEDDALVEAVMARLEKAGCGESLVGASVLGQLELQFVRRAASASLALQGATAAVLRAFPMAKLVKIEPAADTPASD